MELMVGVVVSVISRHRRQRARRERSGLWNSKKWGPPWGNGSPLCPVASFRGKGDGELTTQPAQLST